MTQIQHFSSLSRTSSPDYPADSGLTTGQPWTFAGIT
jgi:hypothetical protein